MAEVSVRQAPLLCLPPELARLQVTDVADSGCAPMAALNRLGTAPWPLHLGERRELELYGKLRMPGEAVLEKSEYFNNLIYWLDHG